MAKTSKKIKVKSKKDEISDFFSTTNEENGEDIFVGEGQLSCDVYQTPDAIIVKSTMAGVDPKNLDISVSNDVLTIRGFRREDKNIKQEDYYARECYWGSFSRSIVLPQEVDQDKTKADLKNGILTIAMPKKYKTTSIKVKNLND